MNEAEKQKIFGELEDFYKDLKSFKGLLNLKGRLSDKDRLREILVRKAGALKPIIIELTGKEYISRFGMTHNIWDAGLSTHRISDICDVALDYCIDAVNEAIGKLESAPLTELKLPKDSIIQKPKDTGESPNQIFDKMQFHPDIVTASKSLFETGHYTQAIFEAFKAVNNSVKNKTGLSSDGKDLMSKAFKEDAPIIKLNELLTQSDKDEQEGFKFLFMGAMVGIRNPKAHDNIIQTDPFRTLEYLALASLLMKRIEEGILVKTSPPRKKWNLRRFLNDTKNRCSQEEMNVIREIYNFTKENADSIYWGTGVETGSFTFHKTKSVGTISIMSVYSDGSIYLNFGYMRDKGVRKDILVLFRDKLNEIPSVKIPQNVVTSNKFPNIEAEILAEESNIEVFKQVILELCQQLDEEQ